MQLTMLGTGNAAVTRCYNTCFVISTPEGHILVDGGGGNTLLQRFEAAGLRWQDMRHIILTHRHIDHLLGIVWMLRFILQGMSRGNYEGEAYIYAHDECAELLRSLCEQLLLPKECAFIDKRLHIVTVSDGEQRQLLGREFCFYDLGSTKAKQFGFSTELESGRLFCCGDEPCPERLKEAVRGSKWLLHEAFCLKSQADVFKPYQKNHSTAADAGALAEELGVENLLLYHTEDKNIERRKELYTAEAKEHFSGRVFVPEDLEIIEL